jgi:hypothetical protein
MNQEFQSEWWEVSLPLGWTGKHEEECTTFLSQNDVGALQISAYRKDKKVTDIDLQEMASEHIEAGAKLKFVQLGSFTGFYFPFGTEDAYWRWWLLRCNQTMVYATYNCAPEERRKDEELVDQIMATLKIRA